MSSWTIGSALRGGVSARSLIVALSAPVILAAPWAPAHAGGTLPTNGQYVAGSGTIGKSGSVLTINQKSSTGIIDWRSFSIGKGNSVDFNNGKGATLNKVLGGDPSSLAGSLKATGSVYLINPEGIIVGKSGRILTGGTFGASTRDVDGTDFMSGDRKLRFTGSSKGNVTNAGRIVSQGGDILLIGRAVNNSGSVSAAHGTAGLAAGNNVLFQPSGTSGRILVGGGKGDVTNSGTVSAAAAELRAAGGNVYALGGNNGGIIRATGTRMIDGHVWLSSVRGTVDVRGSVTAQNKDGTGGAIDARAANVTLEKTSRLWANGTLGGKINVIARDNTSLSGRIVTGGTRKGGAIETSGHNLTVGGTVLAGKGGRWLLDPFNLTVDATAAATIQTALISSDVVLQTTNSGTSGSGNASSGDGDIVIDSAITWAGTDLTLDAYHSVVINAPLTITTGEGSIIVQTNDGGTGGQFTFGNAGSATFAAPSSGNVLQINGDTYTLESDIATLASDIASTPNGHFALVRDYDASGDNSGSPYTAAPIATAFTGTFEGLGHTIKNLSIASTTDGIPDGTTGVSAALIGLFGEADAGSVIENINLSNAQVSATDGAWAGALVGYEVGGTIRNASASGSLKVTDVDTVNGEFTVIGGLVGFADTSTSIQSSGASVSITVTDSSVEGSNIAQAQIGGLVGRAISTSIADSYATGDINGGDDLGAGGLVGGLRPGSSITNSYAMGNITLGGSGVAGGLVAYMNGTVDSSHATGAVKVGDSYLDIAHATSAAGGLVGEIISSNASVTDSYATGSVTGGTTSVVGGLAGYVISSSDGLVSESYATGDVYGGDNSVAGGLIGDASNGVTVEHAYALGNVTNDADTDGATGGMFGEIDSGVLVNETYSNGIVTDASSSANIGAFVGVMTGGTVNGSYFNSDHASGAGSNTTGQDITGRTDAQMRDPSLLFGDFGTTGGGVGWVIVNADGTLNENGAPGTGTLPMLLSEYSTTVTNAHQLQLMTLDLTANYTLANNVLASATITGDDVWGARGFIPVGAGADGNSSSQFSGMFDGQGYTIKDLFIDDQVTDAGKAGFEAAQDNGDVVLGVGANVGLFGYNIGTISNVSLAGGSINGTVQVGGIVGFNAGTIDNVSSSATVRGVDTFGDLYGATDVGGAVGFNTGLIDHSSASGQVLGAFQVGGLAGVNFGDGTGIATIQNSHATGNVIGDTELSAGVGGLVGVQVASVLGVPNNSINPLNQAKLLNDYATGDVSGHGLVGGLAGNVATGTVDSSFAEGSVTGTGAFSAQIGGLIGFLGDKTAPGTALTNSFATGPVSGSEEVGGLVGQQRAAAAISTSYASGSVSSFDPLDGANIGGLVGYSQGSIDHSYATGSVHGNADVGGFVGRFRPLTGNDPSNSFFHDLSPTITDSYSSGSASGFNSIGAFIGQNTVGSTGIVDSFANSTRNGGLPGVGTGNDTGLTLLSTTDMMDSSKFTGWTFGGKNSGADWVMIGADGSVDGTGGTTPMLLSEYSTTVTSAHQLQLMTLDLTADYTLANDIDARATQGGGVWSNTGFIAVGGNVRVSGVNTGDPFSGDLNGDGFFVGGLYINSPSLASGGLEEVGLFGELTGSVENLGIVDANITSNASQAGIVIGTNASGVGILAGASSGQINNVFTTGTVSGTQTDVGGLVGLFGESGSASISVSWSEAAVTADQNAQAGGLVGEQYSSGTITRSYATGPVTVTEGGADVGGFIGTIAGGGTQSITLSYATGAVISNDPSSNVGGFVGENDTGTIDEAYARGRATGGAAATTGGFAGVNTGSIGQTTAVFYNAVDNDGTNGTASTGIGGMADSSGINGISNPTTLLAGFEAAGWTFGGLNSGADWVMIDGDGTINSAGGALPVTLPILLSEYSTDVRSAHELQLMELDTGADYTQTVDIDANGTNSDSFGPSGRYYSDVWILGEGFVPVGGNNGGSFSGIFNGNGHTIDGLTIDLTAEDPITSDPIVLVPNAPYTTDIENGEAGLFGRATLDSVIAGANLSNANITIGDGEVAGALVGEASGYVFNSSSSGFISAGNGVGDNSSGDLGRATAGGLVGFFNFTGGVFDSSSSAGVSAGENGSVGGLVGGMTFGGLVSGSNATGDVSVGGNALGTLAGTVQTGSSAGGLVGGIFDLAGYGGMSIVRNSYATGNVNASQNSVLHSYSESWDGGLIGLAYGGVDISNAYATGNVTASSNAVAGGLIGDLYGTVEKSYATGNVVVGGGFGGAFDASGGLVGLFSTSGVIDQSFATGDVRGGVNTFMGGLVGYADNVSIDNSYALGNVNMNPAGFTGSNFGLMGGLVGFINSNGATISDSYSIGYIQPGVPAARGGFIGYIQAGATLTNDYWDTETSGVGVAIGAGTSVSGAMGQTTAQMEAASFLTSFDGSVWGIQDGMSLPYFNWQVRNTLSIDANGDEIIVQAGPSFISGTAFANADGSSTLSNISIGVYADGALIGSGSSKANGLYYVMTPAQLNVYGVGVRFANGLSTGVAFDDRDYFGSISGLNVYNGVLSAEIGDNALTDTSLLGNAHESLSDLGNGLRTTFGSFLAGEGSNVGGMLGSGMPDLVIDATNAFTLDQTLTVPGNLSVTTDNGDITVMAAITATGGSVKFDAGDEGLGGINVNAAIDATGQTVSFFANGNIGGTGVVSATTLTGGAGNGSLSLTGSNHILNLGDFGVDGNFTLNDANALAIAGVLGASDHTVTLTTTSGGITDTGSGHIVADTLTGSAAGAVVLNATNNAINNLGAFVSTAGFTLTDAHDLAVTGTVATGSSALTLITNGTGNDLAINAILNGGTITLNSGGVITESTSTGHLNGTTLTGLSHGAVSLNGVNAITNLGVFTTNGNNAFAITDGHDLTVAGALNAGAAAITLVTTGSNDDILVNNQLTGGTVTLNSTGLITENTSTGKINATTLTGTAHGAVALNGVNVFSNLGTFTTSGNNAFAVTDDHDLTVTGAVNAGTAALTLTSTGTGSDILINNVLTGGTVTLTSAGLITENASTGKINATTLTGASHGASSLGGVNAITNLGAFTTNGNNAFSLTDAHDFTVAGAVNAGTAALTLATTGAANDLLLNNVLTGGTVTLTSAGLITENVSTGEINATTLTGSSHGAASLNGVNGITNLGAFTTNGNNAFSLTDAHDLTVTGAVNAGTAALTLITTGTGDDLTINSVLTGGTVTLTSAGLITENASTGKIKATTLTGSSHGAVSLTGANVVTNLGAFSTGGNNALSFSDAHDLTVAGAVNSGTAALALKTTGTGSDIVINNVLTGGAATLNSAATISENTGSGKINVTTLAGSSLGGASMAGTNLIGTLGSFANTGAGSFTLKDGKALTVSGAVSVASATGTLALTTTVGNLSINGSLKAPTVTLVTAGEVLEGSAGSVTASTILNVTAVTGINLGSTHNHIKKIGTRHTNSGPNTINGIGQ